MNVVATKLCVHIVDTNGLAAITRAIFDNTAFV